MGQLKQLLPLKERPIVRHSLDALLSSGIEDIVVVLGSHYEEVGAALEGLAVAIVMNEIPGSDMAESVRTGLRAVDASSTGILISLSDHPLVSTQTIQTLLSCHRDEPDKILIPQYRSRKGHPVLFPRSLISDIFSGGNLRDIIYRNPDKVRLISVTDEGIILDIDTMEDYRKILMKFGDNVS
jgi:molybdenum cofactor cytidylyltransferase